MTLYLAEGIKPTLGGHEKFVFRHAWLTKGFQAVIKDRSLFNKEEALVVLGVGKNMVRSIRHWCLATGVLEEVQGRDGVRLEASELGNRLLRAYKSWDPYLEDIATLWLLHWQLVSNPRRSLVWAIAFSVYLGEEFTKRDLHLAIARQFEKLGISTTADMMEREADTCLRTYVPARTKSGGIGEESLDCPLVDLDLVRFVPADNVYRFSIGPKASLPTAVFGYALLSFLAEVMPHSRTLAVDECVYRAGSPGQAFKLDENSVMEHLEHLEKQLGGKLRLQETSGLRQIYLDESLARKLPERAMELLDHYYARN
ncbi:MAG: DUF4007 family protein [Anaerolineales bacterium]|nr:DUF4007 family protein [Anaerolineales bacterium]